MGKLLKGTTPISADNLEDSLTLLGMYAYPGQIIQPRFVEFSAMAASANAGYALAGNGPLQNANTVVLSIDTLRLIPFYVPKDIHIDQLAFVVTVVGGAGSKARVGLYNSSQVSPFLPSTLIVDGGEFDTTSINGKIAAVDVTLKAGNIYWAAYLCGTAAPTIICQSGVFTFPYAGYQLSAATATATGSTGLIVVQAYGALPASLTLSVAQWQVNGTGPAVFFRVN